MVTDDKTPEFPGGDSSVPGDNEPNSATPPGDGAVIDPASQAYSQGSNYAQNAYGQAPENSTPAQPTDGADAAAAYTQGAYTQGAYTQGAYTQGAYTQGAYTQGAHPQPGQPNPGNPASQQPYTAGAPGAYAQGAGYPQAGGYGGPNGPGFPQSAPRPPVNPAKKKKIILFSSLAAGLVLLLVIAIVVINAVNTTQYGPEATVKNYLTAISQGRASAANKLVDPGVSKDAAALLSDDVLKESKELMKNPKITDVNTRGDAAQVEVSYSIDGTVFDGVLQLSKDGKQGLFFDKWKIDKPLLASVYVYTTEGSLVAVNGVDVDFGKNYELAAYPAAYEIGAPESSFFEAEAQTFVAATGSKATYDSIDLELTPTQELTDAVQEQVNAHLDTCAAQTVPNPENCGLRSLYYFDFSGDPAFSYKVDKYPVVTVDESGAYFDANKGQVTGTATGELSYPGGQGSAVYTWDDWTVRGNIVIDGDAVTIEDMY
ncbi:hypothetical protein L1277_000364 [Okibacterium sp. HSC-33S16]|uniref:hypothetical protein n=1 Tax=Okibacterium sp. HSC-33S16 TaxID=2910965 RepID=UPI00209C7A73|nr:hypothetical protein [Okibacterium sp. HSC-33S16]MCP2030300.1 hypothetical protein [Okibacterium sp. HSC-33S16]